MAFGERNSRRYEVQAGPKKGGKHLWAARFFGPVSFFLPLLMCLSNAPLSLIRGKEGGREGGPEREGRKTHHGGWEKHILRGAILGESKTNAANENRGLRSLRKIFLEEALDPFSRIYSNDHCSEFNLRGGSFLLFLSSPPDF